VVSEDAGDQAVWLVLVNVEVLHSLWPKSNRSITFTADGQKPVNGTNGWEVFKHGTRTERGQCCHSCRGLRCAFEYFADGYRDAGYGSEDVSRQCKPRTESARCTTLPVTVATRPSLKLSSQRSIP